MAGKRVIGFLLALVFVSILGIAFLPELVKTLNGDTQLESLTVGITSSEYSALVIAAEKLGLFAKNGIHVEIKEFDSGYIALSQLERGELDIAASTDFAFANKSLTNSDLRILTSIATTAVHELVARTDRGIQDPADLVGKNIGITSNTSGEFFLTTFLILNYLQPQTVNIVNMTPAKLVEAIVEGEVDAILSWDIFVYEAKKELGEKAISWPAQGGQVVYWLLSSTREFVDSRSDVIKRFLKSIVEAEEFLYRDQSFIQAMLADRWDREKQYRDYVWGKQRFVVSLDQPLIITLESQARWKLEGTQPSRRAIPNYLEHIYFDGLDVVKPRGITIFR
jgi:NitT/TauT family transport system substrate-binding protein